MATERHRDGDSSATRSSTSGTGDTTHALGTFSFTPNADTDYLVLVTGLMDWNASTVNSFGQVKLKADGTEVASGGICTQDAVPTIYSGLGLLYIIPADPSPSAIDFTVTITRTGATPGTIGLQDVEIRAVELLADDEWQLSSGVSTTTTNYPSYVTKQTLAFTPPTEDTYYFLHYIEGYTNDTRARWLANNSLDGAATTKNHRGHKTNTATYQSRLEATSATWDASSHSIASRFCRFSGFGTVSVRRSILVALRGDTFDWAGHVNCGFSTTSTSYVESSTLSTTVAETEHWVIWAGATISYTTANQTSSGQACEDGSTDLASDWAFQESYADAGSSQCHQKSYTPSAGSKNWSVKQKSSVGTHTVYCGNDILAFQMAASASGANPIPALRRKRRTFTPLLAR